MLPGVSLNCMRTSAFRSLRAAGGGGGGDETKKGEREREKEEEGEREEKEGPRNFNSGNKHYVAFLLCLHLILSLGDIIIMYIISEGYLSHT